MTKNDFSLSQTKYTLLLFIEQRQKFIGTTKDLFFIHRNQENGLFLIGLYTLQALQKLNVIAVLTDQTLWTNISNELKKQIIEHQKSTA